MAIIVRKNRDGSTRYQVKVRDQAGKWFPTPAFESLEAAEEEELRLKKLRRRGAQAISEDARLVTLNEYWEVWAFERRGAVSDGWKISEDQMWRDYVQPVLGDIKLMKIGAPEIGRVLNRMQKLGLSDQTRKHVYTLMRKMFGDAVEYYEMLAASPVKAKFHRPKVANKKAEFLVPAAAFRLLDHARTATVKRGKPYMGPPVWIQTLAAMRIEAVQGLTWEDVDFEQNQILIRRAWKQKVGRMEDFPKTKDWEYVPICPMLREYLWELRGRAADVKDFVAQGPFGGMLAYETYNRALARLCIAAGVNVVTTHELRHSSTEIWVQAGASAEDIRRLLQHRSLSATARYIHRTDERLTSIGSRITGSNVFPISFPNGNKEAVCLEEEGRPNVH